MQYYNVIVTITIYIVSTGKDPGLEIESFAIVNLHGDCTNDGINLSYYFLDTIALTLLEVWWGGGGGGLFPFRSGGGGGVRDQSANADY